MVLVAANIVRKASKACLNHVCPRPKHRECIARMDRRLGPDAGSQNGQRKRRHDCEKNINRKCNVRSAKSAASRGHARLTLLGRAKFAQTQLP